MKRPFLAVGITLSAFLLISAGCSKKTVNQPIVNPPGTGTNTDTVRKREVMAWVDCRSNVFGTYGRLNDTTQLKGVLDSLKDAGVTGLVVDVKGSTGYTMYQSAYTKQLTTLDGKSFTPGVDYVTYMVKEAHKRQFKVYASIVTFVEGDGSRSLGNVFDNASFKQYESVVCDVAGNRVPITSTGKNAFVNPAIPAVQDRAINIVKEIVQKFDIDGIVLDYCRYTDINADFSDFSRDQFIKFLEDKYNDKDAKNMNFPGDIVSSWRNSSGQILPSVMGKYYKKWLLYRATVIHDFVAKAKVAAKSVKASVKFGVYVGAWYTTYYQVGVNWASQEYDPFNDQEVRFDWAYPEYNKTGYGDELEFLMTGNYFTQLMINDNPATVGQTYHWWSVEGSLNGGKYITRNKMPLYGSIDMGNVDWPAKENISNTIKYILSKATGGIMLFDVVHIYAPQYNRLKQPLWDAVKNGIKN